MFYLKTILRRDVVDENVSRSVTEPVSSEVCPLVEGVDGKVGDVGAVYDADLAGNKLCDET